MKVYGINLCNINTYTGIKKKNYINNHDYQDTFVRQYDIAFGSSDVDYAQKLEELFTNPEYQRAHEILAPVYERIKNPCLRTECVDNEYKLKFIEYVLSVLSEDKCPNGSNTIIIKVLFSKPKDFISYYENIDSEESLDAKKSALNFLLKHPDYTASKIDYDTMFGAYSGPKTLLQLIKSKHAKEFLAHIDSNYDGKFTATQLKTDLGTICGGISSKEKAQACKDIFDFCCKRGYYDASINTYLSAVGDEHGVKYIKTILPKAYSRKTKGDHLNSEFLNWYFIVVIYTQKK